MEDKIKRYTCINESVINVTEHLQHIITFQRKKNIEEIILFYKLLIFSIN
jgi:hypothetical protein